MNKKFKHNKLEQNRGLLLQVSIIISLLIVLAAFNYKSKNTSKFSGNFVEINLEVDTAVHHTGKIIRPLPDISMLDIVKSAEFPGGKNALTQYFKTNLLYPETAKKQNIQGRVYVKFKVNRYGKIKNIKVVRSIHPLLDKEAVRLIKNMPDWIPAKTGIENIETEQVLPIIFINKN